MSPPRPRHYRGANKKDTAKRGTSGATPATKRDTAWQVARLIISEVIELIIRERWRWW